MSVNKGTVITVAVIAAVVLASNVLDNVGPGYGLSSLADKIKNPAT